MVQGLLRLSAPAFGFFPGVILGVMLMHSVSKILPVPSRAMSLRANQVPRPQQSQKGGAFEWVCLYRRHSDGLKVLQVSGTALDLAKSLQVPVPCRLATGAGSLSARA